MSDYVLNKLNKKMYSVNFNKLMLNCIYLNN